MNKMKALINKMKSFKQNKYKKQIAKREDRINLLKEIDAALAEVSFNTLDLKNKSNHSFVQKRLDKIENMLAGIKQKYKDAQMKDETPQQIEHYEKLVEFLSEISISNVNLKNKSEDDELQKKLNKIEAILLKKKANYENYIKNHSEESLKAKQLYENFKNELDSQIQKAKKHIDSLQNENRVIKLYKEFHIKLEKQIYNVKVEIAHLKHKNKVTADKLWWQLLSKEEKKERRSDLSFYIPDVQGYWLTLLCVVAEIIYLILLLSIMVRTFWVGVSILVNIVFLLFLFTIAIKVKNYKKAFSYCSIGFGIYCILRISWVIQGLMEVDLSSASSLVQSVIYGCNIYMIIASIYVGIRSFIKIKRQEIYIKEEKISKIQMSK
ncbi:MAG: hypothetical protein K2P14_05875 [Anaeroplasmataceae bacterium]|jgi:Cytochrome bd-type quinol oxidase, subunit 1|nr:hypothetical protein [Anaeroplasmataceae bacterium]